ncbi:MAG: rhodanese-like domain-containing protein [Saprospiraceae bacterium]
MLDFFKSMFSTAEPVDLTEIMARKPFLVDVRTPGEFASGHPKGAVNIPLDRVGVSISKFKGKKDIIVFCRSGNRSSQAKLILESNGITNVNDAGTWQNVAQYTG